MEQVLLPLESYRCEDSYSKYTQQIIKSRVPLINLWEALKNMFIILI